MKCQRLGLVAMGLMLTGLVGCPEPKHKAKTGAGGSTGDDAAASTGGKGGTMTTGSMDAAVRAGSGGGGSGGGSGGAAGGMGGTVVKLDAAMMPAMDAARPADTAARLDTGGGMVSAQFQMIYDNIIKPKCGGCHGAGAGGLTMADAAGAMTNLVGKASACTGVNRVTPNDLTKSLVDVLIKYPAATGNTPPVAGCTRTNRMPKGGMLTAAEVTQIETWIMMGAK